MSSSALLTPACDGYVRQSRHVRAHFRAISMARAGPNQRSWRGHAPWLGAVGASGSCCGETSARLNCPVTVLVTAAAGESAVMGTHKRTTTRDASDGMSVALVVFPTVSTSELMLTSVDANRVVYALLPVAPDPICTRTEVQPCINDAWRAPWSTCLDGPIPG